MRVLGLLKKSQLFGVDIADLAADDVRLFNVGSAILC
jgi:hypothetical protein